MNIEKPTVIDLLDTADAPALSSTSDMPLIETKPDAQNEGAPPAAPAPEVVEETPLAEEADKTDSESATEPGVEPPASDEPKKAKGVQKRLDELVRQREEERQEKLRLMALLEEATKRKEPEVPETVPVVEDDSEPARPNRANYDDPVQYEEDFISYNRNLAQHEARQIVKAERAKAEAEAQQRSIEEGQRQVREAYTARVDTFKATTPDYAEVAESPDVQVPQLAALAILHSENGPALQYHLGKNPDVAAKLFNLSPPNMLMELGKIEASLVSAKAPETPKPPAISAAPKPIAPIKPATEPVSFNPEEASMEEYAARRRQAEGWADPQRPRVRH